MNKNDYAGLWEHDVILNNFVTAIIEVKVDALNYGKAGINNGTGKELREYYYNIADAWLKNYFDNFSTMDYESFKRQVMKYKKRPLQNTLNKRG